MKKKLFLIGLMMITLLAFSGTAAAHPQNFRAHLKAASGVASRGQGQANFQLDHDQLSFVLAVSKLAADSETTAAHIHISADPGGNGGIFISMCGSFGPPPIPVETCGGPGHPAKGSISLSEDQVAELMTAIAENRAYVNVHTNFAPGGEVRGQLVINP